MKIDIRNRLCRSIPLTITMAEKEDVDGMEGDIDGMKERYVVYIDTHGAEPLVSLNDLIAALTLMKESTEWDLE